MHTFAQKQNETQQDRLFNHLGFKGTISEPGVSSAPVLRGKSACACGGGCPGCQKEQHSGGGEVGGIALHAQVDAGVPPAKAPAKTPAQPPAKTPEKAPAKPDCKYKITYANEKNVECDAALPRGARIRFDIVKVQASGKGCPATLDGLKLTEKVTSDKGCRPEEPEAGAGCEIHADKAKPLEGKINNCTDTYGVCGGPQSFLFAGCTTTIKQELFIGGVPAETHDIIFEIYRRGEKPPGKATRK